MKVKYKVSKGESFGLRPAGSMVDAYVVAVDYDDDRKALLYFPACRSLGECGSYGFAYRAPGDYYESCYGLECVNINPKLNEQIVRELDQGVITQSR